MNFSSCRAMSHRSGEPIRLAARRREVMSKNLPSGLGPKGQRTAGHREPASVAQIGQPLGAPLMRRYFRPRRHPYLWCRRSADKAKRQISTRHVPGRVVANVGPPRLARYPAGRGPGLPSTNGLGPFLSAGTSGAATLVPRSRRSAARVLMDEGWAECNRGLAHRDCVRITHLVSSPRRKAGSSRCQN